VSSTIIDERRSRARNWREVPLTTLTQMSGVYKCSSSGLYDFEGEHTHIYSNER